jgi:isoquinoline 1-oxidoreductase subunit alpha
MATLSINERNVSVDAAPDMPLLWILRDVLSMTGTKFGCGIGCAAQHRALAHGNFTRCRPLGVPVESRLGASRRHQ